MWRTWRRAPIAATTEYGHANRSAAVSYPAHGNADCLRVEDRSFWFRHRNRCIVMLVGRFRPDGPFLDIGGGNGYVAHGLVAAGFPCVLIEPGEAGARAARARGIDPVICATLQECAFRPASIAAAGLFDVLEHIEDDTATLRHVHALLRPGGHLFATVPAYPFLFFGRRCRCRSFSALHAVGADQKP